jgi:hypothetical protein
MDTKELKSKAWDLVVLIQAAQRELKEITGLISKNSQKDSKDNLEVPPKVTKSTNAKK